MKNRNSAIFLLVLLIPVIICAIIFIGGCRDVASTGFPPTSSYPGQIYGRVLDLSKNPIQDVLVTCEGENCYTSSTGYFYFSNLDPNSREIIKFSKSTYVPTQRIVSLPSQGNIYLEVNMFNRVDCGNITLSSGGPSATEGGGFVRIIAGTSFESSDGSTYEGASVKFYLKTFDPTVFEHLNTFPGNFAGRTTPTGADEPFQSFGFIYIQAVEVPGGGPLQLKSGSTAEVRIPIPATLQGNAPNTIEVWTYEEEGGYWLRRGEATREAGGTYYTAILSHLCLVNVDFRYGNKLSYVHGRVVDEDGNPVPYANVKAYGDDYAGYGYNDTDSQGYFNVPVLCNANRHIYAWKGEKKSFSYHTNLPVTEGDTFTMPVDLVISDEVKAQISMTWKNKNALYWLIKPHFTGPITGGGSKFHMTESNRDPADAGATLEVLGNPAIVRIYQWNPGTYRFSCSNHYNVSTAETWCSNMNTSEAHVDFRLKSGSTYSYDVPLSDPGTNEVWKVFEITVGAGGSISSVTTLNTYGNTAEAAPEPYLYP